MEGNTVGVSNRDERVLTQSKFQNTTNQSYPIFRMNSTESGNRNKLIERNSVIKNNRRIQNQGNPEDIHNQQYPIRSGNRRESPFVRENTTQSQYPNIQTENRYPVYRNTERQFSRGSTRNTGILKQVPKANNTYYPQMSQKP
jgi:hypothetical protein